MAPHKKQTSKQRDGSPKRTNISAQDLGIRISPARTPKKLLRNKKRKELIESLSPSPKSSKKSSRKSPSTSKKSTEASSSSNTQTILSFFAKAKPVQYVECPVCSVQVPMSKINQHLDSNCLTIEEKSDSSVVTVESGEDAESKTLSKSKKRGKHSLECSPGRKKADLRTDSKDKRTRLRLKKKIESHALYQQPIAVDSSDSVVESASEMQNQSDVEIVSNSQPKKKVHRELFGEDNNNKSSSGKIRTKSKLSLKRKHNVETDEASNLSSNMQTKTKMATGDQSPYWQHTTASSSDDCVVVRSTPAKEKLSPSQKISLRVSPTKRTDNASSNICASKPSVELSVPDLSKQKTSCNSPINNIHSEGDFHYRSPKKLTPYRPILKTGHSTKHKGHYPTSTENISGKRKHRTKVKDEGSVSKHSKNSIDFSEGKQSLTASSLPKVKPVSSPTQKPPQISPYKLNNSPLHKTKVDHSPAKPVDSPSTIRTLYSPSTSRTLYSPSRYKPSTSTHSTPVNSPMKSSQSLSPAPSTTSSTNSPSKRDPYYLANFKLIFLTVLGHEDDRSLFSEEDLAYVNAFKNLSGPAQQLYVRLFQRKHAWLRAAKLDYPKIATDLKPVISELQAVNFLQGEKELNDIEKALYLLPAPDVKTLAKSLRVSAGGSSQKSELVPALLKHSRQQRSIFNVNMQQVVMNKVRGLLGSCIRLNNEPRTVFSRILLLFSLAVNTEDEEQASGGQTQMQTLLMVNMGRVSYPTYAVFRTRKIFRCREDLIRYEEANQYMQDILAAMGTNDFELALQIHQAAKERFQTILEDEDISRHNHSLPPFLRHFTPSWLYTRLLYLGVEIHQKMRSYGDAVAGLRALLDQTEYCMDSRGRWWDRLALNLDQHLKKPNEALDAILEGLADPFVKTGHHLALQQRAHKIFKSRRNKKLLDRQDEFTFDEIREIPKVTIQGQVLPFQAPGVKNTFVRRLQTGSPSSRVNTADVAICSVEQVALQHYKDLGFEEGVHGEGSVFTTLIFLLFWDIVFMSGIPDAFSYPYQSAPLDIRYSAFYECRKEVIDEKLQELSEADNTTLQTLLESSWKEHEGETSVGVSWELFRDIDHAKGLLVCLGGKILCAIASRILKNHRHTRAGMPDLTVWSTKTNKYKVVEVKGPGDRLSQKQILWIDYLLGIGVDTEVCHVEASGKRLRVT
ncbi:fanconi-associated nuclease 1-like [Amphiura filiformis]|uniref:fanconi-associated nuclease 1-like n=1 Tax=Amphiura filiformis TaxID=82378 RepID=UPI003B20FF72